MFRSEASIETMGMRRTVTTLQNGGGATAIIADADEEEGRENTETQDITDEIIITTNEGSRVQSVEEGLNKIMAAIRMTQSMDDILMEDRDLEFEN
jgi:hypothetical protein